MRCVVRGILAAAALVLSGCTASEPELPTSYVETAPEGSPVALNGALSIVDGRLVGQHGNPVVLRGMSLFWSQWDPQYYTRETVDWLVDDWKITAIRASIAAEGQDSALNHFDREIEKASTVIEAAAANGIYVVLDWHAHRNHPDEAEAFLTEIARRFGDLPNLIYEPFNEPLRDDVDWSRDVKPYHERMVAAIRAIDPDNVIILGTPSWSQDVDIAAQDPVTGENLGYTLHYYAGTHKDELRAKGDAALDAGLALMITEFGLVNADGDGPIDMESSEAWWDWAEANGISWFNWSISNRDESSAALKPGTQPSGWSADDLTESGTILRARLRAAAGFDEE